MQKKLLELYYDARTLEEEQGVNILFLALGTLRWIDPNNVDAIRCAPLVLAPVELERGNAADKFKLRFRQEEVAPNLSLQTLLERVYALKLPMFEAGEEFDISDYAASVKDAVSAKAGWSVDEDDIVLGFFSFAKFLMYKDLDPQAWPEGAGLIDHPVIRPLLSDGFPERDVLIAEEESVDVHVPPSKMVHILDSDSSQTLAIEEVRRGHDLVIQGPPGTGKSQTIANVIASAVADGKTVLFVAEKMAALEVVKRRLDATGVGVICLELHSNKANKRAVLEELRRTWEMGAPRLENLDALNARLTEERDGLNDHVDRLHEPCGPAGLTPYQVIGHLVRLRQNGVQPAYLRLDGAKQWMQEAFQTRSRLLIELRDRVLELGVPADHLWRDIGIDRILPMEAARLQRRLGDICTRLQTISDENADLAAVLETDPPQTLQALEPLVDFALVVAGAPDLAPEALASDAWIEPDVVRALLAAGAEHAQLRSSLAGTLLDEAWATDVAPIAAVLAPLDAATSETAFTLAAELAGRLSMTMDQGRRLAAAVGRRATPGDLRGLETLAQLGAKIAEAPDVDPAAFAQDLWDSGVERAADLARAVSALEDTRRVVGAALSEAAWSADLSSARRTIAAHGGSILRVLNDEWRAADRLVRSFLVNPKAPLEQRLAWLDALGRGQEALKRIRDEADFGRSAFGAEWRGERSASAPLAALVEWMRSLRGLGAEPRQVVARRPDRQRIGDLARGLAHDLATIRSALFALGDQLGEGWPVVFGRAVSADAADLSFVADSCSAVSAA